MLRSDVMLFKPWISPVYQYHIAPLLPSGVNTPTRAGCCIERPFCAGRKSAYKIYADRMCGSQPVCSLRELPH